MGTWKAKLAKTLSLFSGGKLMERMRGHIVKNEKPLHNMMNKPLHKPTRYAIRNVIKTIH